MTRREPSCPRMCLAAIALGSIIGVLLGWMSYDGDDGAGL